MFCKYVIICMSVLSVVRALPCGGIQNVYVCHPKDPTFFQICIGDTLYTMKCPGGLHFNRRTQTCDWPRNANCRSHFTLSPPPPTTTTTTRRNIAFPSVTPSRRYLQHNQRTIRYHESNKSPTSSDNVQRGRDYTRRRTDQRIYNDHSRRNKYSNQRVKYRNPYLGKNPYSKRFRYRHRPSNPLNSVAAATGPSNLKSMSVRNNVVDDLYKKENQIKRVASRSSKTQHISKDNVDKWSLSHYPWWAAKSSAPATMLSTNAQTVISSTPRGYSSRRSSDYRRRKTINNSAASGAPINRLSSDWKPLPRQIHKSRPWLNPLKLNDEDAHGSRHKTLRKVVRKTGKCTADKCKLPDCRCIGSDIPGGLPVSQVPMMIMLTFDDSINVGNFDFYKKLFDGKFRNPDGCGIKGTFFVSGDATQYHLVEELYKMGMDISSHSLSHKSPTTWWARAGYEGYVHEIEGMRKRLSRQSKIPHDHIKGMRVPFLQVGGDDQFQMLHDYNYLYDSSMVTGNLYKNDKPPVWPFTLDWAPDSKTCSLTPCPQKSFPGLWEIPLIRWYGSNKMACAMPDGCVIGLGRKGTLDYLNDNFKRHFSTNRSPLGIFIHASWFHRKGGIFEGLMDFLGEMSRMDNVWVITASQVIDWIKNPVPISQVKNIDSWKCKH